MILFCTAPTHRPTHQWSFRKTGTMGTLAEICAGSKHREHFCGGPGVSPRVSPRKNFGIVHAKFCINLVHFWPRKMVRNAVHNPFHKHFNSENVVPMRSGSFSTTGTAFSSVAPRNGPCNTVRIGRLLLTDALYQFTLTLTHTVRRSVLSRIVVRCLRRGQSQTDHTSQSTQRRFGIH